jgi:Haloacid dehalogenase-like hydrolase
LATVSRATWFPEACSYRRPFRPRTLWRTTLAAGSARGRAGLPWDCILGAETARAYKPQPEAYLAACRHLDRMPAQVLMVAAHNADLEAAKAQGLLTAFVPRPMEHGPSQKTDLAADAGVADLVSADFVDLAVRLGCQGEQHEIIYRTLALRHADTRCATQFPQI